MSEKPVKISTDDARQGETGHGVRYVLIISLFLAVVALVAVFVFLR
jgi:hypothetical protein